MEAAAGSSTNRPTVPGANGCKPEWGDSQHAIGNREGASCTDEQDVASRPVCKQGQEQPECDSCGLYSRLGPPSRNEQDESGASSGESVQSDNDSDNDDNKATEQTFAIIPWAGRRVAVRTAAGIKFRVVVGAYFVGEGRATTISYEEMHDNGAIGLHKQFRVRDA